MFFLTFLVTYILVLVNPVAAIVGGSDAQVGQFGPRPYVVSIERSGLICGGTVVGLRSILTAASCVYGQDPSQFTVRSNSLARSSGGSVYGSSKIYVHPKYDPKTLANDLAILYTRSGLFNPSIAQLPAPGTRPAPGTELTIAGWGATSPNSPKLSPVLRTANVPVVGPLLCRLGYSGSLTENQFCTESLGAGTCQKDGGGPVIQGNNTVVGIASYVDGCGQLDRPGVYTLVSAYSGFISSYVQ